MLPLTACALSLCVSLCLCVSLSLSVPPPRTVRSTRTRHVHAALEQADRADQVQIDSMLSSLAHLREAEAEAGAGVANDAATATVTTPTGPPETGLSDANLAGKAAHAASVAVEDPTPTPAPTDGSVDAASQELHQSRQNTIDDDTFSRLLQDVSSTRTSEERLGASIARSLACPSAARRGALYWGGAGRGAGDAVWHALALALAVTLNPVHNLTCPRPTCLSPLSFPASTHAICWFQL